MSEHIIEASSIRGGTIAAASIAGLSVAKLPEPQPSDPILTVGAVTVRRDGTVTYPEGTDLDDVSQAFWHALARKWLDPKMCTHCGGAGVEPGMQDRRSESG